MNVALVASPARQDSTRVQLDTLIKSASEISQTSVITANALEYVGGEVTSVESDDSGDIVDGEDDLTGVCKPQFSNGSSRQPGKVRRFDIEVVF